MPADWWAGLWPITIPVACYGCEGSGMEFTGVEHLGVWEVGGCQGCAGTGIMNYEEALPAPGYFTVMATSIPAGATVVTSMWNGTDRFELERACIAANQPRLDEAPKGYFWWVKAIDPADIPAVRSKHLA